MLDVLSNPPPDSAPQIPEDDLKLEDEEVDGELIFYISFI